MSQQYKTTVMATVGGQQPLLSKVKQLISAGSFSAITGQESLDDLNTIFDSVSGNEGYGLGKALAGGLTQTNLAAFQSSLQRSHTNLTDKELAEAQNFMSSVAGNEGFSLQQNPGSEVEVKAVNATLNAQSQLQNKAAEALFPTHTIPYEEEGISLKVRAAGIGSYVYGSDAWRSASDLRPIFSLLRSGDMFKNDLLALYPVFDDAADTARLFVDPAKVAPSETAYDEGDAYGRQQHLTQMIKVPVTIPNYLGLCQAPGQRGWTSTDEVEANSITAQRLMLSFELDGTAVDAFVDTSTMSNNAFGPLSNGQSSDDRGIKLSIRDLPGFSLQDKEGKKVGEDLFADIKAAGYEPVLTYTLSGNFQRQTNELSVQSGAVEISGLRSVTDGTLVKYGNASVEQKKLIASLQNGAVAGVTLTSNVTNTSRGNFGYRVEVFDAIKHLGVRRGSPISVKYPVSKDDVNQDSLDYALQQMSVILNNYRSRVAFDTAAGHVEYITSIDGSPVVANDQGSNVLAGQHFVTATAVRRELDLKDAVSTVDTAGTFEAVCAAITNELSDIIAALNARSGLSAMNEYGHNGPTQWVAVVHSNLARFMMKQGDARTLGAEMPVEVVETNFDSQIGKILLVPKAPTGGAIDPVAAIGVCVSKENIVIQGNVSREQQDYGVIMTMPSFKHHPLNPVIGTLDIKDADKFLGNDITFGKMVKQIVDSPKP